MVFPLLFDMSSLAVVRKAGQATLASDAAKTDEIEDVSVPHETILDCMTSCIRVAHINDIVEQQNNLVHVFITSMSPGSPWTVKISAFSSIKELCSRLNKVLDDSQRTSLHANLTSLVQEVIGVHFIYYTFVMTCLNAISLLVSVIYVMSTSD
ncbi:hypothetical protein I3842_13G148300 [Carya illinoinensis]|uniref:Uncharacterized protein n=1 Tax=Carya illinoinensis TaxID=32201 RepID=A0A922AP40_CARIL|nr:hypothetical protein I3842_13G148300 [Carya illinoinensis]